MGSLRLYGHYLAAGLRAQMLYPTAFLLRLTSQFFITLTEFAGVYALFHRFGHIGGWYFSEIALFYAVVTLAFAGAEMSTRGFEMFGPQFVKTGDFDRVLLRPRSTTIQLSSFEFGFTSVGRLLQGVVALVVALALLPHGVGPGGALLLVWSIIGGCALFWGIMVLQATLSFWTVEGLEITNTLTYGGVEAAQYPLDIYASWFRHFLIFVIPLGCVVYFPVATALGHADKAGIPPWLGMIAPLAGFLFLALAFQAWRHGIRRYTSTGS